MKAFMLARVGIGQDQVVLELIAKSHMELLALGLRLRCRKEYGLLTKALLAYVVIADSGRGIFVCPRDEALEVLEAVEAECISLGMPWQQEHMTAECFEALRHIGLTESAACIWELLERFDHNRTGTS